MRCAHVPLSRHRHTRTGHNSCRHEHEKTSVQDVGFSEKHACMFVTQDVKLWTSKRWIWIISNSYFVHDKKEANSED